MKNKKQQLKNELVAQAVAILETYPEYIGKALREHSAKSFLDFYISQFEEDYSGCIDSKGDALEYEDFKCEGSNSFIFQKWMELDARGAYAEVYGGTDCSDAIELMQKDIAVKMNELAFSALGDVANELDELKDNLIEELDALDVEEFSALLDIDVEDARKFIAFKALQEFKKGIERSEQVKAIELFYSCASYEIEEDEELERIALDIELKDAQEKSERAFARSL